MFQAWSSIVYMLIPNVDEVEKSLGEFADIMEVISFSFVFTVKLTLKPLKKVQDIPSFDKSDKSIHAI